MYNQTDPKMNDIQTLENSPMFHLSLSSKELFHSNFLYWLSTVDRHKFVELLNTLLNTTNIDSNWGNWTAVREYKHFDFCIKSGEGNTEVIHLVLENKFKSIPNKKQLDEYYEKTKGCKHHILLTLIDDFQYKDDVKQHWKIINYDDLSIAISQVYKSFTGYISEIIKDYTTFISAFHSLSTSWKVKRDSHFINTLKKYEDLRIDDIYQKFIYGKLLECIICDLGLSKNQVAWGIGYKEMFSEKMDISKNHIFVNSGLTNSQGLLEMKVRLEENTVILIQLQGRQYRRCIERKIGSLKENYNWLCDEAWKEIHDLFSYNNKEQPLKPYPKGLCKNNNPFKEHKIKESAEEKKLNGFCKFGNRFIYQYIKIDDNVTVGTIIDAVISDIKYFLSLSGSIGTNVADLECKFAPEQNI